MSCAGTVHAPFQAVSVHRRLLWVFPAAANDMVWATATTNSVCQGQGHKRVVQRGLVAAT